MEFLHRLAEADLSAFHRINGAGLPWLDPLFLLLSSHEFGFAALAVAALAVGVRRGRRNWAGLLLLVAAVAAADLVGARLIKPWVGRVRPCYFLAPDTLRLVGLAANVGSMPSLHAANFFAAAGVVWSERRRAGIVAYLAATLVALSRVYLGVHWPADVVGGALLGSCIALSLVLLRRAVARFSGGTDGQPIARPPGT
jgi:undecaprenyl-diphosphatase